MHMSFETIANWKLDADLLSSSSLYPSPPSSIQSDTTHTIKKKIDNE
jgi:hypothetical protein